MLCASAEADLAAEKAAADKFSEAAAAAREKTAAYCKARGALKAVSAANGAAAPAIEAELAESKMQRLRAVSLAVMAATSDLVAETEEAQRKTLAAVGTIAFIGELTSSAPKPLKELFAGATNEVRAALSEKRALEAEVQSKRKAKNKFAGLAMAALLTASVGQADESDMAAKDASEKACAEAEAKERQLAAATKKWQAALGKVDTVRALQALAKMAPKPVESDEVITLGEKAISTKFLARLKAQAEMERRQGKLRMAELAAMAAKRRKSEVCLAGALSMPRLLEKLEKKAIAPKVADDQPAPTKEAAMAYLTSHKLEQILQAVMNEALYVQPHDPIAFISYQIEEIAGLAAISHAFAGTIGLANGKGSPAESFASQSEAIISSGRGAAKHRSASSEL